MISSTKFYLPKTILSAALTTAPPATTASTTATATATDYWIHGSAPRLSELRSFTLGATFGAILADPMATIHSWNELLDLLVF